MLDYLFISLLVQQSTVNEAKPFPEVLEDFHQWLTTHELGTTYKFTVVTDGYVTTR